MLSHQLLEACSALSHFEYSIFHSELSLSSTTPNWCGRERIWNLLTMNTQRSVLYRRTECRISLTTNNQHAQYCLRHSMLAPFLLSAVCFALHPLYAYTSPSLNVCPFAQNSHFQTHRFISFRCTSRALFTCMHVDACVWVCAYSRRERIGRKERMRELRMVQQIITNTANGKRT